MGISVRFAGFGDIEELIKVRFDFFDAVKREGTEELHSVIESSLRRYLAEHLNGDCFVAVAEEDGAIVSAAFLTIFEKPANSSWPTGKTGTIFNVLTYPEYRKKGCAGAVMRMLIEEAKRQNLSFIELSASDEGRPVYEELGFLKMKPSGMTEMKLQLYGG